MNEVVAFVDSEGNKRFATADRNGFFYVLNREDGAFVSATPFVSDITWASGIDETGRPIYNEDNRPGNPLDADKGEMVFSVPSFLGGKNWMPMAFSQNTGMFYVPSNEWGMDIWNEPISYKKGAAYLGAGFTIKPIFEDHIGSLKAIQPARSCGRSRPAPASLASLSPTKWTASSMSPWSPAGAAPSRSGVAKSPRR